MGSNPTPGAITSVVLLQFGGIAPTVERLVEAQCVVGANPTPATIVEYDGPVLGCLTVASSSACRQLSYFDN